MRGRFVHSSTYVVGTVDSVLIREVSLIQSVLYREVPLYHTTILPPLTDDIYQRKVIYAILRSSLLVLEVACTQLALVPSQRTSYKLSTTT